MHDEVTRIQALFDSNFMDQISNLRRCDTEDPETGFLNTQSHGIGDFLF